MTYLVTILPWILSAVTIWMTVLAGNRHPSAWLIGISNQVLWLVWIVLTGTWGLIPMNLALWFVYVRNQNKWMFRDTEAAAQEPERYVVGNWTVELVFRRNGMTDMHDMQAVMDAVEDALFYQVQRANKAEQQSRDLQREIQRERDLDAAALI